MKPAPVEMIATDKVRIAIDHIGRTEDVLFSSDGMRMAIVSYGHNACWLFDIEARSKNGRSEVHLFDCLEVAVPDFRDPHGAFFLDADTIAVSNRGGRVPIIQLPRRSNEAKNSRARVRSIIGGRFFNRVRSPGSVTALALPDGLLQILVCENYKHRVSRHLVNPRRGFRVKKSELLLQRGIDLPDGIASSPDSSWIAVSCHNAHAVRLYANTPDLGPETEPVAELIGLSYPHGVRFSQNGAVIVAADAGQPFVNVYRRPGHDWHGTISPSAELEVLDPETFQRGHVNPEEGGPKGIDFVPNTDILATTCEESPLSFFDLSPVLEQSEDYETTVIRSTARVTPV